MKALLVGDNRALPNWGGRGQSIALHRLVRDVAEDVAVIGGKTVGFDADNDIFIKTLTPYPAFKFVRKNRSESFVFGLWYKMERLLGARDVVSDDPEKSAALFLRFASRRPGFAECLRKLEHADVVVINGEGSGVFSTPFRRDLFFYLMVAELSIRFKKKTYFVNTIISDCPITGRNTHSLMTARRTLAKCEMVAVRDTESLEYVQKEMPDVKGWYVPDALFTWFATYNGGEAPPRNGNFLIPFPENQELLDKLDFSRPYICVGGSSLAAYENPEITVRNYCLLVDGLRQLGLPVYLTECCAGDRFLHEVAARTGAGIVPVATPIYLGGAVLSNARLFVSGRYHAAILASLGGTPCVFLKAHSHKMASLQRVLEYQHFRQFSEAPSGEEIGDIVALSRKYLADESAMRLRIREVCRKLSGEAEKLKELFAQS